MCYIHPIILKYVIAIKILLVNSNVNYYRIRVDNYNCVDFKII